MVPKIVVNADGCWEWTGSQLAGAGYGRINLGRSRGVEYTHRVVMAMAYGEIPTGLQVDHLCRNRICCNPSHLELVSAAENTRRGESPGMAIHRLGVCVAGHPREVAYRRRGGEIVYCQPCRQRRRAIASRIAKGLSLASLQPTEDDLLAYVLDLSKLFGWQRAHFRPARTGHGWRTAVSGDGAGFPDLALCRPPRLVFAELKSATGKLSHHQQHWLTLLAEIPGVEVFLWRPKDLDDIVRTLR